MLDENLLVSPMELHALMDSQPAPLVVDVRTPEKYEAGHVAGARNIPKDELLQVLMEPPINRRVVVYCDMHHPGNSSSEQAARLLRQSGYEAHALGGGFPAWKAAGYDVDTGYNGYGTFRQSLK